MNQDLKDLRDAFIWWILSGRGPTQKSMWHVGAESRPQGTGHKDESERELGYAGYGEVPGFHSWQSGEVRMVLSSRMTWADFPCNPPPGCCVETRLGGGGVGGQGRSREAVRRLLLTPWMNLVSPLLWRPCLCLSWSCVHADLW